MDEMEKLGRLIPHWRSHNEEHALGYKKWAEEAESYGFHKVAEILKKVHEETLKINSLFEEAEKEMKGVGTTDVDF